MISFPITADGRGALENELKHRLHFERPRLIGRVQAAIADEPNFVENSDYQSAKAEQERNEARIAELGDRLARAEVIDPSKLSGDTVTFGAKVTLIDEDNGQQKIWQIVGEPEADPSNGKISAASPAARALIGKVKREIAEIETPGGIKTYRITNVQWP